MYNFLTQNFRIRRIHIFLLLAAAIFMWTMFSSTSPVVHGAPDFDDCIVDEQGPDDEPAQSDLNQICINDETPPAPYDFQVSWHWDETGWPGGNTGDACVLFDVSSDADPRPDHAICVTVGGNPAEQGDNSPRIYDCGASIVRERCENPSLVQGPYNSQCTVSVESDSNPFGSGTDGGPDDTVATCNIDRTEVGGTDMDFTQIIDVCTYNSEQPNSNDVDCISEAPHVLPVELMSLEATTRDMVKIPVLVSLAAGLILLLTTALILAKRSVV